jgi:outer membrane protein
MVLSAFMALLLWAQAPQRLTLDQAIDIALRNSFAVRRAASEVAKSRGQVDQGYATLRPRVDVTGTWTRNDKQGVAEFPGKDDQGNDITQRIVTQPLDNRTAAITASHQINLGGQQKLAVQGAKALTNFSEQGLAAEKTNVVERVRLAYYDVWQALSGVAIADEAVKNAQERQRVAEVNVEAGTSSKIDILRAKTQVADNQQRLIKAVNGVALAKASFNNVLARDVNTEFDLAEPGQLPTMTGTLADITAQALSRRPEVLQSQWNVRLREANVSFESRGNYPNLNLSVAENLNFDTTPFNTRKDRLTGVASVSFPIFDGGITKARTSQARADLSSAKTSLDEIKQNISLEIKQDYLALTEAGDRLKSAAAAVTEAEEALRLSQVRYKNDVAIQLEVSDSELALTQARLNEVNARYDYFRAYSRLQKATGLEGV